MWWQTIRHYGAVGVNTMPIYTVPANQAEAAISVTPGCTDFTVDTGTEVPIPSYAALTGFSDSPLVIYQPSTGTDWEFWQLTPLSASSYHARWGGRLSLATSDGVFPAPYGLSATGISYLATTITEADVESGSIDHAIAVPCLAVTTRCTPPPGRIAGLTPDSPPRASGSALLLGQPALLRNAVLPLRRWSSRPYRLMAWSSSTKRVP